MGKSYAIPRGREGGHPEREEARGTVVIWGLRMMVLMQKLFSVHCAARNQVSRALVLTLLVVSRTAEPSHQPSCAS